MPNRAWRGVPGTIGTAARPANIGSGESGAAALDVFKSDKAPYVLGLLVTVIGWHVSQFVSEIQRTQAVSYSLSIDPETREVVAEIRNVSRTKSLINATFSLACRGGAHCLAPLEPPEPGETPDYGRIRSFPPNSVHPAPRYNEPSAITFTSTVAAGGRYAIIGRAARADAPIEFYYVPDSNRPLDIFIYRRNTVTGFLVENYLRMLVISFLLCLAALIFSIILSYRAAPVQGSAPEGERIDGA